MEQGEPCEAAGYARSRRAQPAGGASGVPGCYRAPGDYLVPEYCGTAAGVRGSRGRSACDRASPQSHRRSGGRPDVAGRDPDRVNGNPAGCSGRVPSLRRAEWRAIRRFGRITANATEPTSTSWRTSTRITGMRRPSSCDRSWTGRTVGCAGWNDASRYPPGQRAGLRQSISHFPPAGSHLIVVRPDEPPLAPTGLHRQPERRRDGAR